MKGTVRLYKVEGGSFESVWDDDTELTSLSEVYAKGYVREKGIREYPLWGQLCLTLTREIERVASQNSVNLHWHTLSMIVHSLPLAKMKHRGFTCPDASFFASAVSIQTGAAFLLLSVLDVLLSALICVLPAVAARLAVILSLYLSKQIFYEYPFAYASDF